MDVRGDAFRIAQFTDLHLGEGGDDMAVLRLMRRVVATERPDLIVFTGDQVAGYAVFWEQNREALWLRALSVAAEFGVPFATVFGNHDDQPYRIDPFLWHGLALPGGLATLVIFLLMLRSRAPSACRVVAVSVMLLFFFMHCATTPTAAWRRFLLEQERQTHPRLSYTGDGDYRLVLRGQNNSVALYFLDTGGGRMPEAIRQEQLDWLRGFEAPMPSLAFMHIPPFGNTVFNASVCTGPAPREGISSLSGSGPLLQTLAEIGTIGVFVGHDHDNSWCCPDGAMLLCYGRHMGGYGTLTPGARIIDLRLGEVAFKTRVMEY